MKTITLFLLLCLSTMSFSQSIDATCIIDGEYYEQTNITIEHDRLLVNDYVLLQVSADQPSRWPAKQGYFEYLRSEQQDPDQAMQLYLSLEHVVAVEPFSSNYFKATHQDGYTYLIPLYPNDQPRADEQVALHRLGEEINTFLSRGYTLQVDNGLRSYRKANRTNSEVGEKNWGDLTTPPDIEAYNYCPIGWIDSWYAPLEAFEDLCWEKELDYYSFIQYWPIHQPLYPYYYLMMIDRANFINFNSAGDEYGHVISTAEDTEAGYELLVQIIADFPWLELSIVEQEWYLALYVTVQSVDYYELYWNEPIMLWAYPESYTLAYRFDGGSATLCHQSSPFSLPYRAEQYWQLMNGYYGPEYVRSSYASMECDLAHFGRDMLINPVTINNELDEAYECSIDGSIFRIEILGQIMYGSIANAFVSNDAHIQIVGVNDNNDGMEIYIRVVPHDYGITTVGFRKHLLPSINCYWLVLDGGVYEEYHLPVVNTVSISDTPAATMLLPNHPNPFNPSTTISFTLSHDGSVRLEIYDVQGRLVKTLIHAHKSAGRHEAIWNATDEHGRPVSSGVYTYNLHTSHGVMSRKMVLTK